MPQQRPTQTKDRTVRSVYLQAQMASERREAIKELGTHKQAPPNSNHPPPPPWGTGGPWQGVGCYWLPFGQPTTTYLASHGHPGAAHHASKMRRPGLKAKPRDMSLFLEVGFPEPRIDLTYERKALDT